MTTPLDQLRQLLKELRDEKTGCAWTRQQSFKSLAQHTLDESHELVEAIENEDMNEIKNELGDLLYHIVFYAQIAEENQAFDFDAVAEVMLKKHEQRMPSKEQRQTMTAEQINAYWQQAKRKGDP